VTRRSGAPGSLLTASVNYVAVGDTRRDDLLGTPPHGFRPIVRRVRFGAGDAGWADASHLVSTWGVQRGASFRVEPVHAASVDTVSEGDVVRLRWRWWPLAIPARVVYVVDEPRRRGFAYGSLPGHPECGEEAFLLERRDDDSVWFEVRAFSRPATLFYRLGYPALRVLQELFTRRYLHTMSGAAA
jgi:uncharacterized protein (UPF0548 family)